MFCVSYVYVSMIASVGYNSAVMMFTNISIMAVLYNMITLKDV